MLVGNFLLQKDLSLNFPNYHLQGNIEFRIPKFDRDQQVGSIKQLIFMDSFAKVPKLLQAMQVGAGDGMIYDTDFEVTREVYLDSFFLEPKKIKNKFQKTERGIVPLDASVEILNLKGSLENSASQSPTFYFKLNRIKLKSEFVLMQGINRDQFFSIILSPGLNRKNLENYRLTINFKKVKQQDYQ